MVISQSVMHSARFLFIYKKPPTPKISEWEVRFHLCIITFVALIPQSLQSLLQKLRKRHTHQTNVLKE